MSKRNQARFVHTGHLCRNCGTGPIMMQTNSGPSGGGNPYFECAVCRQGMSAMGTQSMCYCGWRGPTGDVDQEGRYRCFVRAEESHLPDSPWQEIRLQYALGVLKRREW